MWSSAGDPTAPGPVLYSKFSSPPPDPLYWLPRNETVTYDSLHLMAGHLGFLSGLDDLQWRVGHNLDILGHLADWRISGRSCERGIQKDPGLMGSSVQLGTL